jgi:hypothetical protein
MKTSKSSKGSFFWFELAKVIRDELLLGDVGVVSATRFYTKFFNL